MSYAIGHFGVGGAISLGIFLIVGTLIGIPAEIMMKYDMLIVFCGGVVAMLPDASKLNPKYKVLHDNFIFSNICFFHGLIDKIDAKDEIENSAMEFALLGIMIFCSIVIYSF